MHRFKPSARCSLSPLGHLSQQNSQRPRSSTQWTKISSTQYTRPMDQMEKLIQKVFNEPFGQRTHDVAAVARIKAPITTTDLEKKAKFAWKKLRLQHPLMGCVLQDDQWVYTAPTKEELDVWAQESFIPVEKARSEDVIRSIGPSDRPTLFYLKDSNEFLLHTAHDRLDGRGAGLWFHDFLTELSQCAATDPTWTSPGEEVHRLPPGPWPMASTDFKEAWLKDAKGLPDKPHGVTIQKHEFSESGTQQIRDAARRQNTTVTPLLHSAVAIAMKEHANLPDGVQHNTYLISDVRNHCPGPCHTGSRAAALRMGFWPLQVPIRGFNEVVADLSAAYESFKRDAETHLPVMPYVLDKMPSDIVHDILDSMLVSNMGNLSRFLPPSYRDIELMEYWAVALPAGSSLFFAFRTWNGRLAMRVCYDEHYYSQEQVQTVIQRICRIIRDVGMTDSLT
ncbi:hypothetical protein BDV25DRAFT_129357 [Aspergillus avenaceus]|uniref:Condensation domain-containing protein n=1 Tax=Aspergillus avenaceus TaxID=36643 RepID=A0A5N6TWA1_ASPAV|nr:hypothetical protein BDV25DRAFT_129357 [Aspergillus avenaceus]